MTRTLQWYIFREMGKTFVLAAVGLTLAFSMCGGVLNIIGLEGATALQVAQILGFILPVATTLTLPVAAMFSAAMTYGRLSADREFDACRSSGINIHWLLTPSVVIGLLAALFTFYFSNFVIPSFVKGLESLVRKDIQKIVTKRLSTYGWVKYGRYVVHADRVIRPQLESTSGAEQPHKRYVDLTGGAFIELSGETPVRLGTGAAARVEFDIGGRVPLVRAGLRDVVLFDRRRKEYLAEDRQTFGPFEVPQTIPMKPKWLNLPDLLRYRRQWRLLPKVEDRLADLRERIRQVLLYRAVRDALGRSGPGVFRFGDDQMRYELRTRWIRVDPDTEQPEFKGVQVIQTWPGRRRTIRADFGTILVQPTLGRETPQVQLVLYDNVVMTDSAAPGQEFHHARMKLPAVPLPKEIRTREARYSDEELLAWDKRLDLGDAVRRARLAMSKEIVKTLLQITGVIHARLAFSASVPVLVILAAALGIIFRGGQVLVAFFISFLPGLFVTITIIMGRQLAENTNTALIGLAVIWGGIVLMGLADALVIGRFLRR